MDRTTRSGHEITDEQILQDADYFARHCELREREDIKQEIALALVKARDRYDPRRASWKYYASVIALHAIREYWRNHHTWDRYERQRVRFEAIDTTQLGYNRPTEDEFLDINAWTEGLPLVERRIVLLMMLGYKREHIKHILRINDARIDRLRFRLRIESLKFSSTTLTDIPGLKYAA